MRHAFSIRTRLLSNLVLMLVVMGGLTIATTYWFARRQVARMSASIIDHTLGEAEQQLQGFFEPVYANLRLARQWGEAGLLEATKPEDVRRLFGPVMTQFPQISAIMVADTRGRECMLLRTGETWHIRLTRRDEWGDTTRWTQWREGESGEVERYEKQLDYDPRRRPWFEGAVRNSAVRTSGGGAEVFWTSPYIFYTTKDPGITASATYAQPAEPEVRCVVGFDILLNDISDFTMNLKVSARGAAIVVTHDMEVIGLPNDERFGDEAARRQYLLKRPEQLGTRFAVDATEAFTAKQPGDRTPVRFQSEGETWWGKGRLVSLSPVRHLWIGVIVPEADLVGDIVTVRLLIGAILLCTLLGAVLRAAVLSRRFSAPVEQLVAESDRISRGDLAPGAPVATDIKEFRRLAAAHEHMRQGLEALLKLEGDLKLARDIQQRTFPRKLPTVVGFDIVAWNCPADETGGDTYDVIGYRRGEGGGIAGLCDDEKPDGVVLLLADATGHGIGPALSVTQVRAMLRMAVRAGEKLPQIITHLNDQLCADLPTGRFVTTWIGDVSAAGGTLTSFSAGQGPILHYDAEARRVTASDADALPLGITPELGGDVPPPRVMKRGDIHAVISDGIFEASAPDGEDFGRQRVIAVIEKHHARGAADILKVLRESLDAFRNGAPQEDDQTVILIKRL